MLDDNEKQLLREKDSRKAEDTVLKELIVQLQYQDITTRREIEASQIELKRLEALIEKLESSTVSKEAFQPIRNLHYAIITAIMVAVVAALMSTIININPTVQTVKPYIVPRVDYPLELKPLKKK